MAITPATWDVFKIAEKAVWLGTVEAPDKQAAIEKAAEEFKTEVWRLYAVARR
jgi:Ser/Thr protein kinase RdoA (MazF antagonist)